MTEMKQRSLLERFFGKPLPWVAWVWAALAAVWIFFAVVAPSNFHTFMAIAWSVLAVIQLGAAYHARRQQLRRAKAPEGPTITH
ncbi:hypothetical protein [Curtobacterium sp. MCPF17_047]|uniref:hypothetical protein n=1 Tax=Curtobacterium sp. MCPF17_047 TaxID=2175654 RepID=UPI0011B69520|nr:hypothetical protein [Curtobacterium sp. MCPF17_047]